jgi:hypothetical protein
MGSVAAPVLLALLVALAVLVLSALISAGRPVREVVSDGREALRGGLARERWVRSDGQGPGARRRAALLVTDSFPDDDEESTVTDLFVVGRPDPDGYVRVDRLATALEKAQGVVVGGVQQVQHRVRR